jgi:prophage antirepressor-like protein
MNLEIFNNTQFGEIRTLTVDDEPLFVASDIARALGYKNTSKAIKDHCKGVTKRSILDNQGVSHSTNTIKEGDVYRLIIKSKLPEAAKFETWVCDDVIPTIRKTGGYLTDISNVKEVLVGNIIEKIKKRKGRPTELLKQYIIGNIQDADTKIRELIKQLHHGEDKEKAYICVRSAFEQLTSDKTDRFLSVYQDMQINLEQDFNKFKNRSIAQKGSKEVSKLKPLADKAEKLQPVLLFDEELTELDEGIFESDREAKFYVTATVKASGILISITDMSVYKSRTVYVSTFTKNVVDVPDFFEGMCSFPDSDYALRCRIWASNRLEIYKYPL